MADFNDAFEKVLGFEGGYKLHTVPGDRGGMTYAGIARNTWPDWNGWMLVDSDEIDSDRIKAMVRDFYRTHFWNAVRGDQIAFQKTAFIIYDFAVNAGIKTSVKIAQEIVGAVPDGIIGPDTIRKMSAYITDEKTEQLFIAEFSLRKVFRYKDICMKRRSQIKFLCGWINRVQKGIQNGE